MTTSSIGKKVFKGASWLAMFKLISQLFSWGVTILVARILVPEDYGLMAMATIITGYAEMFAELGLGAAIIQKPKLIQEELSSVFWFSFMFGSLLALSCFPIAHLTAFIFHEPRVIPLTMTLSLLFILSSLQIVPLNLLKKELDFKIVGIIEMTATFVACSIMIIIAKMGGGVWTLLCGFLIRSFTSLILIYYKVRWLPKLHFNFNEAKSYLKFGITMALGRSLFYVWEQSDKFFAGRAWNTKILGYYSFAIQLAQIPTEKIVVLINQVAFPAFSKLQDDKDQFNTLYLNITKVTATIVLPLFVGGFLVGDNIVRILLNEKWYPIIFLFKYLCLSQIMMAMNAINNFAHAAQGRPHWGLCYHAAAAILMPVSFYLAVPYGLNAILIPWFTTFLLICSVWIITTLKKLGVPITAYIKNLSHPILAVLTMAAGVTVFEYLLVSLAKMDIPLIFILVMKVATGGVCYLGYLWVFNRQLFHDFKKLRS